MLTTTETENDPIRQFQSELEGMKNSADRLRPIVKSCEEAIFRSDCKASVTVALRNNRNPKVNIMFFCKTLNEVIPLLRELAKEGLHTNKSKTHQDRSLFDVISLREYDLGPQVTLMAMLSGVKDGDGPTCRMEQVGVEEVPIYEMKCD